jgi:chemotaxis protein MotB
MTTRTLAIAAFAALMVGCVPKGKYDTALQTGAELTRELEMVRGLKEDASRVAASLGEQLEAEQARVAELEALVAAQQAQAEQLQADLDNLAVKLGDMAARSRADKAAKAELEALLGQVQDQQKQSADEAEAARQRADALKAEAERLRTEQEALQAEAERLRAEREALAARTEAYDDLVGELQAEIDAGQVQITELSGKLTVSLSNAILFDSGSIQLKADGQAALVKVAGVLARVNDRSISVEGHTDTDPVRAGAPYADNRALSALRASTVVSLLVNNGVDPLNIAAVGLGEHRPVADNDTADGKAANRRTEIVLVPRLSAQ